ncbi:MAG TPA: ChaN family lipoprotein, partial [Rubrivivax sp.]|nr:ChaN family lipoprotein [Rubrivivax sp.]
RWEHYLPFIALALEHELPVIAANVSRDDARAAMRDGLAAHGFDATVPDDLLAVLAAQIEASHCGMLDATTARRMALAQVARDQFMARVLEAHAGRGVVLLAGNGHVRTDVGVPRWLSAGLRSRSLSVGMLEEGDTTAAFDRRVFTAPQPRPDPCASFRIGLQRSGSRVA